jgi:hypothetical protein
MQKGRHIDLLPCVISLEVSHPNFIFSNFKLKSSCRLVVHNDHLVDLVDLINVLTCWPG